LVAVFELNLVGAAALEKVAGVAKFGFKYNILRK
jgi:hypothetical protein